MHYFDVGGLSTGAFSLWFAATLIWSLAWKGYALWRAAERKEKWWFIIFLVVNTLGILEIIYLFAVIKDKWLRSKIGLKE